MQEMNLNQSLFDAVIRSKLMTYEMPVPDDCWSEIEKRLDQKSSRKMLWFPWLTGIAAGLALFLLLSQWNQKNTDHTINQKITMHKPAKRASGKSGVACKMEGEKGEKKQWKQVEALGENELSEGIILWDEIVEDKEIVEEMPVTNPPRIYPKSYENLLAQANDPFVTSVPKSSSTNANAIRLYVGTGGSYSLASDNSDNDYATLNPPNAESDKEDGSPSWNGNGEYPVLTPDELTKITHYLPLSVGLSIKKNIHPDFALETGIVYTYLASRIKNNYPHWEADLQLHYIGIPLNLHAQLYHAPKDRWKIYAALGVMAEKGVLAHYSQNEYLYQAVENVTINEKIKGLQWSLNTSLGLDYMLNRNYGIYFEPRVSYYLDNNQPMSARTENPLVIGISAGVRYSW